MKNDESLNLNSADTEIFGALTEFRDALRDGIPIGQKFTVRTVRLGLKPRDFLPEDIKRIRKMFHLSQAVLGLILGVSVRTVSSWEQGRKKPSPIACRFLDEMATDPTYWRKRIKEIHVPSNASTSGP
jgi:putative transcriptional regulator